MAAEVADTSPALRGELQKAFAHLQGRMEKGLTAMKARRELVPEARPHSLAQFTIATLQGGMLLSKTTKKLAPLRNSLGHALEHLRSFSRRT